MTPDPAITYERDEDGWWVAQVSEVRGAVSQGRTQEEAHAMVLDALALALDIEAEREEERHPSPNS